MNNIQELAQKFLDELIRAGARGLVIILEPKHHYFLHKNINVLELLGVLEAIKLQQEISYIRNNRIEEQEHPNEHK